MPRIDAAELLDRIAKGKPVPAILLLGDEAFLRDSCRALLIGRYVPEGARDWGVSRYSARAGQLAEALDQAQTLPMLVPRQVVFLEEVEALEKLGDEKREEILAAIEAYLNSPAPFTVLVLEAAHLDQRMKIGKLLAEKTLTVTVGLGEDENERRAAALVQARDIAAKIAVALDSAGAEELAECVAGDLQRLKTELEKLATHAGEKRRISRDDVAALVISEKKNTVWQLAEMIADRRRDTALEFLDRVLRDGEEPVALVGAVAWMYRKLLEAQEFRGPANGWQAARQLGMRPDSAEIALRSARCISRQQLLEGLRTLRECDDRLKGGIRDVRALLDFLTARLTGNPEAAAAAAKK